MRLRVTKEEEIESTLLKLRERFRAYADTIVFDMRWSAIGDDGNYIFLDGHEERVKEIDDASKDVVYYMEKIRRLRAELYEKDGKPDERLNDIKGQENCGGNDGSGDEENHGAATE